MLVRTASLGRLLDSKDMTSEDILNNIWLQNGNIDLLSALSGRVRGGHLGGITGPNLRGDLLPMDPALAFNCQVLAVQQNQG
jgi:hypothetical protein